MGKISHLCLRAAETIREDGVIKCVEKTGAYITISAKKVKTRYDEKPGKVCKDVLFINGCYLPHPARYRVIHQMEQLTSDGINNEQIFYSNISLDLVKKYRVFIFFRCVYTDEIGEFIKLAKKLNKTVLYDIDDLVIDRKYTDQIKYLNTMSKEQRDEYNDGVERMGKVLKMCDGAITTTERLAEELKKYVPEVYINRNTASEEMVKLSEEAIYFRDVLPYIKREQVKKGITALKYNNARKEYSKRRSYIRMGYFSGSITHNDDIKLILPVLKKIMERYLDVQLYFVGELDVPEELKEFADRVVANPFVSWKQLPRMIASVDINLAPLENSIFNEAKSENKWVEAALVKVPTVASKVGAFEKMIEHGVTGYLCSNDEEWYQSLCRLIEKKNLRKKIAEQAYGYAKRHCTSIYKAEGLGNYIRTVRKSNISFILPSVQIGGGMLVVLKHAVIMQKAGYDVTIYNEQLEEDYIKKDSCILPVISTLKVKFKMDIDKVVASLWSTCYTAQKMQKDSNIKDIYYLVQGFETDFYAVGMEARIKANATYNLSSINYRTISKWCEKWLKEDYHQQVKFAPNGLYRERFYPVERKFNGKIRILVEGNCDDDYKNVDESFQIIEKLDKDKYEIWFMSNLGTPKEYYRVDKFLHKIPYEKVPDIYRKCHILIKSSILESFSYPPLEMMATGGYVVVSPNEGNIEYLRDHENAVFYKQGDIESAVNAINEICCDENLRKKLYNGGLKTADERDWSKIELQILDLYQ